MATIGIDLGSHFSVVATVGRGLVDIVRNDISERLTPSLVGFSDRERLLGDPALTSFKSNFRNTCRNINVLLGRTYDSSIEDEQAFSYPPLVAAENGLVGYKVTKNGDEIVVNGISAMAALLSGLIITAERSLKQQVAEAVISVPSWYDDRRCQAMLDAAKIAGIDCLRVMSEHAATALDYGIFRASTFHKEEAHRVMFVDVGYASTSVFITDFVQNELRVVHVECDTHLGGRDVDRVLAQHMAMDFSKRMKVDILKIDKVRMKIEEAVVKVKKVLSTNQDAAISLESIYEDEDLNANISRDEFTEKCLHLRTKLEALLRNAFQKNGGAQIHSIELVGGSTRVPWVQESILEVAQDSIGAPSNEDGVFISRTLNQDECVAKGCALQAAMLSPRYKVREFNVVDSLVHPVAISFDSDVVPNDIHGGEGAVGDVEMTSDPAQQTTAKPNMHCLVTRGSAYPTTSWMTFSDVKPFNFQLHYTEPDRLPPSTPALLGTYRLHVPSAQRKPDAKLKLAFEVDRNRRCQVKSSVREIEERTVKEKRKIIKKPEEPVAQASAPVAPSPGEGTPNAASSAPPADAAATPPATASTPEFEWVDKQEKHVKKTLMIITVDDRPGWLGGENHLKELREKELAMLDEDRQHIERKEKLNDLESYIYNIRDKIETGVIGDYFEPTVKTAFLELLNRTTDWIYDEGENAQKSVLTAKLDELKAIGDRAVILREEKFRREEAVARFVDQCRSVRMATAAVEHLEAKDKNEIVEEANQLEAWVNGQVAIVAAAPLFAEPALTSEQIMAKIEEFTQQAGKRLTPPPPPKSPKTPPPAEETPKEQAEETPKERAEGTPKEQAAGQ